MDWLKEASRNWKLKTSFIIYMLVSLCFSMPLGIFIKYLLSEARSKYLVNHALSEVNNVFGKLIFSKALGSMIDISPILVVLCFFYLFFQLFYLHKIQPVLNYLSHPDQLDLTDINELSDRVFALSQENLNIKEENFANIIRMNEVSKQMDSLLHEIKNPLTILSGDLEIIDKKFKFEDERLIRIIARMTRSTRRIQDYIQYLSMSQHIKDIEVNVRPIKLNALIVSIEAELNNLQRDIHFRKDISDLSQIVHLDLALFIEGMTNILRNSDAYAKSKITIKLFENDQEVILEIEDDGPGFSQEALQNYNKAYFSENPLVGNMGLGLYITDEIMKKLGVKMVLNNKLGASTQLIIKKS
ncbi:sensor histidine kinase [Eremococcus coleocola]|uniref:sensor histidine kinase n=1 Tax=Eremococcus coleocola TaxID=88132 RepID=UPI00040B29B3|nr:HAMP domain-containing sensor histidine kinase [Eremococcus coleocola]